MEVHAHTHPAPLSRERSDSGGGTRKKWTHYLWEFLMLFLAVFCGFLAENQREHYIEHQREKQFMRSMIEDLQKDTVELEKAIVKAKQIARYSDSAVIFLRSYKPGSTLPTSFAVHGGKAGLLQSIIHTDRTSSQLKNSGAMRLIRDKKVNEMIIAYWKQIGEINISLERYMLYRNASRDLAFSLFVFPEVYMAGTGMPGDSIHTMAKDIRVIDNDPKKWDRLNNLIAMSGFLSRGIHLRNLQLQLEMARDLIATIKEAYHFK
jgi:hypothetical protein